MRSAGFGMSVGGSASTDRLGPVEPRLHLGQLLLGRPHRVEVGVELAAVGRADPAPQGRRLRLQAVEDAAAVVQALRLARDLVGRALQEELAEQPRGTRLGRHHRPARCERLALRRQRAQDHGREPGHVAEVVRGDLVERDGVAEPVEPGAPRRRQPRDLRVVGLTAALLLVREAREHRVARPVVVEQRQVLGRLVAGPGRLREPGRRVEPQGAAHRHEPLRARRRRGAGQRRGHRLEQGQGHGHAGGAQERAAVEGAGGRHGYRLLKRSLCTTS